MKNRITELRAERDWTQADLAQRISVSRQTIIAIEKGKFDPSLPVAFRLAKVFDLTIEATEEAILDAMAQGGIEPEDIDYINAHGSGTKQNDRHETAAYKRSLGDQAYKIPISSIKSMIGHSLGGIGAVEMAACALAIDRGVVPPTANWENPDPECDLDYTPCEARRRQIDAALSTGSGFGGFQSAMILARPKELQEVGI